MIKKSLLKYVLVVSCFLALTGGSALAEGSKAVKPSPDAAITMLKDGNKRFISGKSTHPNIDASRLALAGKENQGDYAYATIIACSDSRVPVEILFDAGVMDIFSIRIAGNVIGVDELGSIEYGLSYVRTPVLVMLGHTKCGAVTAVANTIQGHGHKFERNIPPLVDKIVPAVKKAITDNPKVHGDEIIPYAIEENVWKGIEDLFMESPASRNLVNAGKVKVVGAIYDVSDGTINWLSEAKVDEILKKVEKNPKRAIDAMEK